MTLHEAARVAQALPQGWTLDQASRRARSLRKVVLLRTLWYPEIIDGLEASARNFLQNMGVRPEVIVSMDVPGSFELPLAALNLLESGVNAPEFVVALGCVVRGGTPHFDFVCQAVSSGLMDVQLKTRVPVGFGVLTVDNREQALERQGKGAEAAQAAFFMYLLARAEIPVDGGIEHGIST